MKSFIIQKPRSEEAVNKTFTEWVANRRLTKLDANSIGKPKKLPSNPSSSHDFYFPPTLIIQINDLLKLHFSKSQLENHTILMSWNINHITSAGIRWLAVNMNAARPPAPRTPHTVQSTKCYRSYNSWPGGGEIYNRECEAAICKRKQRHLIPLHVVWCKTLRVTTFVYASRTNMYVRTYSAFGLLVVILWECKIGVRDVTAGDVSVERH